MCLAAWARLFGCLAALTAVIAVLTFPARVAVAQPVEDPDAADLVAAPTLSLDALGSGGSLFFYGDTSSVSLSLPVPPGLTPTELLVTLDLPFPIRSGILSVTQDDRLIAKLGLPLADLAPLVIPLNGVEVVDESVDLTLRLNALPDDEYCLDGLNPIGFINGAVTYAGTELPPTSIADFLPPILRTMTIGLPSTPSQAESEAAVQLAANLESKYRSQAPQIVLVPLPAGATTIEGPSQPRERRIVIKEGPDAGISLSIVDGFPQLLVSGSESNLTDQARFLTDPSVNMAVSTNATASQLRLTPPFPGDSTTLAQLGQPNLAAAGIAPQVNIQLDQTRFGRSTQAFRVHVMGSYTPVPADIGARVTASVYGQIIDTWPVAGDGAIDRWVTIPDRLVARYTELSVQIDTSGHTGRCGEFRPLSLEISGSTVVQSSAAQPPIPPGFLSMPQALMPRIVVGISDNDFADTVRATQIVMGLQSLSVLPLTLELTSLEQAIESDDPAILITADGWTDPSIMLPVSADDRRLVLTGFGQDDEETTITLDPGIQFGSLQTVFVENRSLLIATSNGAPAQLDELLAKLTNDPGAWAQLRGNAVVAVAGREPEMVPDRTPLSVYGPLTSQGSQENPANSADEMRKWRFIVGAAGVVFIGAVLFWMRTRKSRSEASGQAGDDR